MRNKMIGEMFRYAVIGASSSIVDFLAYVGFTRLIHIGPLVANVLAYLVGHLVSYFGNRHYTFRTTGKMGGEYFRFWVVNIIGLALSQAILAVGLHYNVPDLYAKVAAIVLSGYGNFMLNRYWTYRKPQKNVD